MTEVQALQAQMVTLQGRIQAGVAQLEESPMDTSTVIPPDLEPAIEKIEAAIPAGRAPLYSGWPLALQADTGMFLCRWQAFGFEATKASPDESSWFAVGIRGDGAITLQADTARYLSLENTQDLLFDKDVGEVDQDCWFIPTFNGSGQVAFQAANGLYVSRNGAQDFQAYKSALDQYCWLTTRVNTTGATSG
jgi:hypothetical protein